MHGADGRRVEVDAYAKRLMDVLGEEQVMAIARRSRWLRRARKVMPLMMVVAVLSTLGSGGAKCVQLRYKPFHKQLAKAAFAEMFRMLLEATVQRMPQPVDGRENPRERRRGSSAPPISALPPEEGGAGQRTRMAQRGRGLSWWSWSRPSTTFCSASRYWRICLRKARMALRRSRVGG